VRDSESVTSPVGSFWFHRETIERDPMRIYEPAARRAHRDDYSERQVLFDLLEILEREPSVGAVASQVRAIHAVVARWALVHGATVSLWECGYAAVRATARHPFGGIAVIECLADRQQHVETLVYHWIDDWSNVTRRSWRAQLRAASATDLQQTLDHALRLLLDRPSAGEYEDSPPYTHGKWVDNDREYWAAFQILR